MTRIISIANQKGGVGKTTTVINLGASLAVNDREVLLIDMDPQANATGGFGMTDEAGPGIAELLLGKAGIDEVTRRTEMEGLCIIPGSKELAGLEIELASSEYREFVLAEALEKGLDRYDYVLIDCPPSLGLLTLNALVASTEVLVAMQSEFYALEGLTHLLRTVRNVRSLWNPGLKINGVLLTMYDGRLRLNREVAEEVEGHLGGALYETRIPRNVKLSEAPSYGKPVLLYDARSTGALSYLELAREVLKR